MRRPRRATLLSLVVLLGALALVALTTREVSRNAEAAWRSSLERAASEFAGTLMLWTERSIAPLSSLSSLYDGTTRPSRAEWLAALELIERSEIDVFPTSIAVAVRDPDSFLRWRVEYSTDRRGPLASSRLVATGSPLEGVLTEALDDGADRFMSLPSGPRKNWVYVARRASRSAPQVHVAAVDLGELARSLLVERRARGLTLTLGVRDVDTDQLHQVGHRAPAPPGAIEARAGASEPFANRVLQFDWAATRAFGGGPDTGAALAVALGGTLATVLAASLVGLLLRQNSRIAQRVRSATVDLQAAKRSAERSQALLVDAIESVDAGLAIYDENERLVIFNDRFTRYFAELDGVAEPGKPYEQLLRETAHRHVDASGVDAFVQERLRRFRSHRNRDVLEFEGRWLAVSDAFTTDGGSVTVAYDVTDLKQVQADLERARDQAEAGARAKAAFLASMSHEIRTPMNGVIGMVDLLRGTSLDGKQADMVATIRESSLALLTIINDILDFSKVEAGKLDFEAVPLDLGALIDGVCHTLQPVAATKGIELRKVTKPEALPVVVGDPVRIRQVLFNLAGNAVKFTEKGSVEVRAHLLVEDVGTATVRLEVADTGIGIDEEARSRLFDAFTQAESSTTRRFGGTGLGLAICQRLAALMGTEVEVDSTLGEGSRFSMQVTLPLANEAEIAAAHAATGSAADDAGSAPLPRVLVAEDNVINRKVVGAQLAQLGYEFEIVNDGAEALEALERGGYDILLTDCHMPNMDGFELVTRLRERECAANERMPVVAVTASAMSVDRDRCFEVGCDDIVTKPIEIERLREALVRWAAAA